jgi:hypothetical protein
MHHRAIAMAVAMPVGPGGVLVAAAAAPWWAFTGSSGLPGASEQVDAIRHLCAVAARGAVGH